MPVDTKHPDYLDRVEEWQLIRDTHRGEPAIKARGTMHLPMPSGFAAQDDLGVAMYSAYKTRAQVPELIRPTLRGMVGLIHRTEAQVFGLEETGLTSLYERATYDGLNLESFHRRITSEILLMGRYGILVDANLEGSDPFLAGYPAESIINWDQDRSFFVLDESGLRRQGFEWRDHRQFRVLNLVDGFYSQEVYEGQDLGTGIRIDPTGRGRRPIDEIPFVVVGPEDLKVHPEDPPLIGVARSSMAMYRLDADYRHQMFWSGQDTLVVINGDPPKAVGAGVVLSLKSGTAGITPDAKYIGPRGNGIEAHERAMEIEGNRAVSAGAKMFDTNKKTAESGEALRIRFAAQTATLTTVALASANALERSLRYAAMMAGRGDPQQIVVKPNLDFVDITMSAQDAVNLVKVWQSGAISKQTLYENFQKGEIASYERTFDQEEELIEADPPDLLTNLPPSPGETPAGPTA